MTEDSRLTVSRSAAVATLLVVLVIGAGSTYYLMNRQVGSDGDLSGMNMSPAPPAPAAASSNVRSEVIVPIAADAAARAGIEVVTVTQRAIAGELRLPAVVEPNAYRQVSVTPLVGGRVVRVSGQLGDRVRKGQSIAQVYSPELAEARTRYVAASARLDAHDRELKRTERLVEIGAASKQDLERIHAEHAAQSAEVKSARSRLRLLGASESLSAGDANATSNVPAPLNGVITERLANVGLNVDPSTKLFTIVDLSTVWVVADVFERDLPHVREGVRARITTAAAPASSFEGRVSYIDPQLNVETRTAKARIEVPNPAGELRLGMFADVVISAPGATSVLAIPREALQNVGSKQVVYVALLNDPSKFAEREVRLGGSSDEMTEVVSGVNEGDHVAGKGSFFIRAEAERLGLRTAAGSSGSTSAATSSSPAQVQVAKVVVGESAFDPVTVPLRAGVPARITFVRTTDKTCATEVTFPSLNLRRALPLNTEVVIEFTPTKGTIAFVCGMNMLRGAVVAQ